MKTSKDSEPFGENLREFERQVDTTQEVMAEPFKAWDLNPEQRKIADEKHLTRFEANMDNLMGDEIHNELLPICTPENISIANGSVFMGVGLVDMSKEELMCCIVSQGESARQSMEDRRSEIV